MTGLDLLDSLEVEDNEAIIEDITSGVSPLVNPVFWDAKYINEEHTCIDMMLAHPVHGDVPITINPDDYPEVWAEVVASGDVADYAPPTDEEKREVFRARASLSRAEFCTALRAAGILNRSEAIAAAKGDWPASFEPMLDSMTEAEADAALILWAGLTIIERTHPLLEAVRQFKGLSQEDVDALFGYKP